MKQERVVRLTVVQVKCHPADEVDGDESGDSRRDEARGGATTSQAYSLDRHKGKGECFCLWRLGGRLAPVLRMQGVLARPAQPADIQVVGSANGVSKPVTAVPLTTSSSGQADHLGRSRDEALSPLLPSLALD